jgi:tetraacyldisaccharide 4'-kinase
MERWFLDRWYRKAAPISWLLPLAWVFERVVRLRWLAYRKGWLPAARLPVPVVVVGNITVGGTGKTPLTLALVAALKEGGWHPAIVSRGHGSPIPDPRAVPPASPPWLHGDEPVLMARSSGVPVWAGVDRVETAQALLAQHPEVDVLVSDDGLQHYALARDVELAVFDGPRGLGNGAMLPAGPLREPPERLREVDAVIVNGAGQSLPPMPVPVFSMALEGRHWVNLEDPERELPFDAFRGQRCHAVAGIGNPERFFSSLAAAGIEIIPHPFPDHHLFEKKDLRLKPELPVLMTEKDGIKCEQFAGPSAWMMPVSARLDPGLLECVLDKINRRNHGRTTA